MPVQQSWEIDVLQPSDAAGTVALYREIYGDDYPVRSVYDMQAIIRQGETGDTYRIVARGPDGEVFGHIALYRSTPPNRELYEIGQLMVRKDSRTLQTGDVAFALLEAALSEIPDRYGVRQIWGEAVCNHLFTQRSNLQSGFSDTALEVDLMPGKSYTRAFNSLAVDDNRVSTVASFRVAAYPAQQVWLPQVYEEFLRQIYAGANLQPEFGRSTAQLPETDSVQEMEVYATSGVARISFKALGKDFSVSLAHAQAEALAQHCLVLQVFLPLSEPWVGQAVAELRRNGFFFGGALPCWFGGDGLLMQKIGQPPNFSGINLYSRQAKQILEWIRDDWQLVQAGTVGGLLAETKALVGSQTAFHYYNRDLKVSFDEFYSQVELVAKALIAMEPCPGGRVALWAPNQPEYLLTLFACAKIGIPLTPINPGFRSHELEYVLRKSEITTLFLTDGVGLPGDYLETLLQICPLPHLKNVVVFGETAPAGTVTWAEFLQGAISVADRSLLEREATVKAEDVFLIQYSSGTTGFAKGAALSHAGYTATARAMAERQRLACRDVVCLPLPLSSSYGFISALTAVAAGAATVVLERFIGGEFLLAMQECRATAVCGTPTMFVAALEELERRTYSLCLRGGVISGANCPPELLKSVVEKLQVPEMGTQYGSTETLVTIKSLPQDSLQQRMEYIGTALPATRIRIVDPQTGRQVPVGQPGELCVKGPGLMRGYYNDPVETAKAIDAEGWLHSGDLACSNEHGYYRITGRIKDVIIRGGENIYPAEIEAFLLSHPQVADVQVLGIPDAYYGEIIVAFVQTKQGDPVSAAQLKSYCRSRIALNKVPAQLFFVKDFPFSAGGKVQKHKLREQAIQLLQR